MTDNRIERGQEWLKTLLQLSGLSVEVTGEIETTPASDDFEDSPESDSYWLTIDESKLTPEQIATFIGPDGSVLDAVQYLANTVLNLNQSPDLQASYTVELNGYRVRRYAEIRSMAEIAAEQARASGLEVEIKSLSSAERRQVHTLLKEFGDLETFSRGKEPHRHLVVRLASLA
ncbi:MULTISPECIES: Jag family protein [Nostocales]|uniref:RNA-binding protein n=3 Tax=Nostocales TaxID=1161 RepID=A0A0C1R5Z4_9CYAN|nr:R3H domain-containing nucleic acid-binding protein [Tolypothrix bouteillei]KAF3888685.1 RNA-binding protein [Tolypothrix bouteillei VB521301]